MPGMPAVRAATMSADVVADVEPTPCAPQRGRLVLGEQVAGQRVDLQPEVLQVQPGEPAELGGDHHHPAARAAGPPSTASRAPGSGRDGGDRVRRDRAPDTSGPPSSTCSGGNQRRSPSAAAGPSRAHRRVGVDVHAGHLGQRPVRRGDPGTGVEQGHVEVEPDGGGAASTSCTRSITGARVGAGSPARAGTGRDGRAPTGRTTDGHGTGTDSVEGDDHPLADHLRSLPDEALGRPAPAASGPRRAGTGRHVRSRRPGPVPGVGGPRPGRARPVHPADPRRGPADPEPGRRHRPRSTRCSPWPPAGPRAGAGPPSGPRWTGCARCSCCTGRRTRCASLAGGRRGLLAVPGGAGPAGGGAGPDGGGPGADPARLRRTLLAAPPAARAILDRLAAGPPVGHCRPRLQRRRSARTPASPVRWLASKAAGTGRRGRRLRPAGRRRAAPRGRTAAAPRHRARSGRCAPHHRRCRPAPEREPKAVDSAGAGQAMEAVRHTEALLEPLAAEPAPVLRSGGLGVRDLRRLARTTGLDEPTAALLLEVAYAAGLLGELDLPGATTARPAPTSRCCPPRGVRDVAGRRRWRSAGSSWPGPGWP